MNMKFDTTTIIPFPTPDVWGTFYTKFRKQIINMLNGSYCLADREDAVEYSFHKLMYKKDIAAYGENMPQTESDWFWSLYWQARAYLSHLSDRAEVHAKYVERTAKALKDAFVCGHQGEALDREIIGRALARALVKKHGPRHFAAALRREGYGFAA